MQLLGYPFWVKAADVDELSITHPDPAINVVETAVLKANAIAQQVQSHDQLIIAADTIVALDGHMLGKPQDDTQATEMLQALRNREHEVYTGLVLLDLQTGRMLERVTTAVVTMRNYTDEEIAVYVASGDPLDKAGAYAIQHPVFKPAAHLDGCFTAVMGLSVCDLIVALTEWNVPCLADLTAVRQSHQIADMDFPCPIYGQYLARI